MNLLLSPYVGNSRGFYTHYKLLQLGMSVNLTSRLCGCKTEAIRWLYNHPITCMQPSYCTIVPLHTNTPPYSRLRFPLVGSKTPWWVFRRLREERPVKLHIKCKVKLAAYQTIGSHKEDHKRFLSLENHNLLLNSP